MIRLVATDLDGTLWDRTCELRPEHRDAIDALTESGIAVLAATGRRPRSARVALEDNGLFLPAVCLDGTFGWDFRSDERFHTELFHADHAGLLLEIFDHHEVAPNVFVDHPSVDVLLAELPSHQPERAESLLPWAMIGPLADSVPNHQVAAFTVIGGEREVLAPVAAMARDGGFARATLTSDSLYGGTSLSIIPARASKWAGVVAFAARLGIGPDEILAVGDAANDLEMLIGAAHAVVVRTAAPDIVEVADTLIDPPAEGGWQELVQICAALS